MFCACMIEECLRLLTFAVFNALTANVQPITDSNGAYFQDKEHLDGLVAKAGTPV